MRTSTVSRLPVGIALGLVPALAAPPPLLAQEAPRAQGLGYSVPIPTGFHADSTSNDFARSLWAQGGVLLSHDSAPGRINVTIVPAGPAAGGPRTLQECREGAAAFARAAVARGAQFDLESAGMAETPQGPACQIILIEPADAHKATFLFMTADTLGFGITCNYEVRDGATPPWCRKVIDGWLTEQMPSEGAGRSPRYDSQEYATGNGLFVSAALDEQPQLLSSPPVTYPSSLQQANIEGSVTLAGIVGPDGRVEPPSIRVVESTHPDFEPAAAEMLLGTVFRPGKINGQPVRVLIQIPIKFGLKGKVAR